MACDSPPSLRRGYALPQWSLRGDCRPSQRPQVRSVGCRARLPSVALRTPPTEPGTNRLSPMQEDAVRLLDGALAAGRDYVEHLERLGNSAFLHGRANAGFGRGVRRDLQGASAATKAVELQRRSDHGDSAKAARWLTVCSCARLSPGDCTPSQVPLWVSNGPRDRLPPYPLSAISRHCGV